MAAATPAPLGPVPIGEIRAARERIAPHVVRTPLVRLPLEGLEAPEGLEVWLKLENLQPIGSFKLRGASNAIALADPDLLARGVWTPSAGNMAQGVAWQARRLGIPCTVVAPDHAPAAKLDALRRLGARVVQVPFEEWFEVLEQRRFRDLEGLLVHPVADPAVMAGNGTIALEVLEDRPDVEAMLVPFGGGGLSCGIASALRAVAPEIPVLACEVEAAAPLAASLAAGRPVRVDRRASFVDGIGAPTVLTEMWPLARSLVPVSRVVPVERVAAAVRLLAERSRVIAEGAGATAVAVALAGLAGARRVACIVSGGNIDPGTLTRIFAGETP